MAFARAKIQRFNEVVGCAPPPGTYEPRWQARTPLGVIERGRRFTNVKAFDVTVPPLTNPKKELPFRSSKRVSNMKDESSSSYSDATNAVNDENTSNNSIEGNACNYDITRRAADSMEQASDVEQVNSKQLTQSYQQELISYRLKIAELEDKIDCLMAEKNVWNMNSMAMSRGIKKLLGDIKLNSLIISEAKSLVESRKESVNTLQREVEHLKANLESSQLLSNELKLKYDNLQQELVVESSKKEELKTKYEIVLHEAEDSIQELNNKINYLTKYIQNLVVDEEVSGAQAETSVELDRMQNNYEEERGRQEEYLSVAREELGSAMNRVAVLENVIYEVITEICAKDSILINRENLDVDNIVHIFKSMMQACKEKDHLNETLVIELRNKECEIKELKQLIGPYRNQLQSYESERQALEKLTNQTKEEYEALSRQHASLLGHQNHKQKIQYLVQLNEKNKQLTDEVQHLKKKLRDKERTIEKLTYKSKDDPKTPTSKALRRSEKENA